MITDSSLNHPKVKKQCPYCNSRRIEPTNQYGIAATEQQLKDAAAQVAQALKGGTS